MEADLATVMSQNANQPGGNKIAIQPNYQRIAARAHGLSCL